MSVTEIERELKRMTNAERLFVIEIASQLVRGTLKNDSNLSLADKRQRLKKSAEIMLSEYAHDEELTAMTVLDGEEFHHAQRRNENINLCL